MRNKLLVDSITKTWKRAKEKGEDCYGAVMRELRQKFANLTDYQRGYLNARLEEISNCLSSEEEDWLWEVQAVLRNL